MKCYSVIKVSFFVFVSLQFITFPFSVSASDKHEVLAILPLSGDMAAFGESVKNGIELGLLQGKGEDLINVRFEDDGGLPRNTVSALLKEKSIKKPDVVITGSSGTSKSIAQMLDQMKIPLLALATDEEISKGRTYAFNFWLTPEDATEMLIQEAVRRGYKNVALFSSIHPGTHSLRRAMVEQSKGVLELVYDEEVELTLRDFKSIVSKFKNKTKDVQVDAILTNIFFGQIGIFARQLRELGFRQDLFCVELFEDQGEVASSAGALYDQWYVQADDPEESFIATYKEKYPSSSIYGASNGADAIHLILDAIRKGAHTTKELATYFKSAEEFQGNSGKISARGDNRFTFPATVKIVTKEGFKKCGNECVK